MASLRPPARPRQRVDMVLIGEARDVVVGLRLKRAADQAPLGVNAKDRQGVFTPAHGGARRLGEMFDQRGDEYGLARAGEAGHAKANMRAGGIVDKAARDGAGFVEKIRDEGQVERPAGFRMGAPARRTPSDEPKGASEIKRFRKRRGLFGAPG